MIDSNAKLRSIQMPFCTIPSLMADFTGELHRLISEYLQCKRRKDKSVEPTPLYYLWSREAEANDTTPYLMVLLLNNDVWCKSREVVVLRNLIEQAWGKVLGEDKEGANKQVISSQADSLIKISRIWADFFPANTSNQPI